VVIKDRTLFLTIVVALWSARSIVGLNPVQLGG